MDTDQKIAAIQLAITELERKSRVHASQHSPEGHDPVKGKPVVIIQADEPTYKWNGLFWYDSDA